MTDFVAPSDTDPRSIDRMVELTVAAIAAGDAPARLAERVVAGMVTELDRRTALALSRRVRQLTPDPRAAFALPKTPGNERNAPCPCGSGSKYKHCCQVLDENLPAIQGHFLPELLDALPRADWRSLVGSRIDLALLADAVDLWLEQGRAGDVVLLLEPFFTEPKQFRRRQYELFRGLLDAYEAMRQPRLQSRLLEQADAHGDSDIRFLAHLCRASLALEAEDAAAARACWNDAARLFADAPALAELDLRLMLIEGRAAQVAQRAADWSIRLDRAGFDIDEELADLLHKVADEGPAALT